MAVRMQRIGKLSIRSNVFLKPRGSKFDVFIGLLLSVFGDQRSDAEAAHKERGYWETKSYYECIEIEDKFIHYLGISFRSFRTRS